MLVLRAQILCYEEAKQLNGKSMCSCASYSPNEIPADNHQSTRIQLRKASDHLPVPSLSVASSWQPAKHKQAVRAQSWPNCIPVLTSHWIWGQIVIQLEISTIAHFSGPSLTILFKHNSLGTLNLPSSLRFFHSSYSHLIYLLIFYLFIVYLQKTCILRK